MFSNGDRVLRRVDADYPEWAGTVAAVLPDTIAVSGYVRVRWDQGGSTREHGGTLMAAAGEV